MQLEELEVEKEILEPVLETVPKEETVEEPEELSSEELEDLANQLLFDFLKEIENAEIGKLNLNNLKNIIEKVEQLKEQFKDNQEYQDSVDNCLDRMKLKLSSFIKTAPDVIKEEELNELLLSLFKEKIPVSVDLSGIDIERIVELYDDLQKAIESKDLKQETAARGRLIKKLKKEQKNIKDSFDDIETLAEIGNELLKDDASIERVKEILEADENRNLYLYFKNKLNDLETFINEYQKIIQDEEIQKLFFLAHALTDQLEEHKENLDKRFSKEFLDKKSKLTSVFTELPNAIALSIQKLNTSIDELKQAETQRRKMDSIKNVMKEVATVLGTPIVFTGKYLVSNWYTFFMAYQGIKESRREAKRIEEEKARQEAERREAEEKAKQEKLRQEREKAEQERQAQLEAERREAKERERQEQLRLEKERQEAERREAEERARQEQLRQEQEREKQLKEQQAQQEQEQEQTQQQEQKETDPVKEDVIPQPTQDPYQHLRGTRLYTMIASVSFYGNIYEQLESGLITPDSQVRVTYSTPGAKPWEFWKREVGYFTLWEIQEIWNWQCDLEKYANKSANK